MSGDSVYGSLRFGPFELSSRERVLRREGSQLPLGSRALDVLVYLAERAGEVIPKKELIDHVWPGITVEEVSLRVHIAAIRKALCDGQFGNRYTSQTSRGGAIPSLVRSSALKMVRTARAIAPISEEGLLRAP